ncbi:MAG: type II secretion system protein [Planctomycetota bacterium]|nr:type II secretion system protein [Planctomycetota bacterium]
MHAHPATSSARAQRRSPRQGGWTIWETLVAVNVLGMAALLIGGLFASMEDARHRAQARQVARGDLQRNLEALATVLRRADLRTLDGFDSAGRSARPLFARATIERDGTRTVGPREELRWSAVSADVPGVASPGRIVHVREGAEQILAENVPGGQFTVRWDGGMLVVELATYHVVGDHAQVVRGSTAVLVRN